MADTGSKTTSGVVTRALDLIAGRVQDVEVLIEATGRLRTTLDRYDYFIPHWLTGRGVNASSLKLTLVLEFEAVSSAARKVGGRKVLHAAAEPDGLRGDVLWVVEPPNNNGIPETEARELMDTLNDLRVAANRRRQTQATCPSVRCRHLRSRIGRRIPARARCQVHQQVTRMQLDAGGSSSVFPVVVNRPRGRPCGSR